jgi:DNA-binding SARP family transcriptional activator
MALLAYLAVTDTSHRREALAALLWPESDARRARNALRSTLSFLRRALNGVWLMADRGAMGLDGSHRMSVDVVQFRDLLEQCGVHGHPARSVCGACLPLLEAAVELY